MFGLPNTKPSCGISYVERRLFPSSTLCIRQGEVSAPAQLCGDSPYLQQWIVLLCLSHNSDYWIGHCAKCGLLLAVLFRGLFFFHHGCAVSPRRSADLQSPRIRESRVILMVT